MSLRHARSGEIIVLSPFGVDVTQARTAAIVKNDAFEAIRLVVHVGKDIKTHSVDGPTTIQCLEGRAIIGLPQAEIQISAGQWLYLEENVPHSVTAVEHTCLLVTIIFPQNAQARGR
ncbi:cupin [Brucella tritici]|uniref:cupin n=1 Tax=Brucella tritici TaxID=94626 RepID=UPI001590652E|nr:cupin [Brucella tritici]